MQMSAEEVSFEWAQRSFLSTDSKVRTTLHVAIIESGRERVSCNRSLSACIIPDGSDLAIVPAMLTVKC